MLVPRHLAVTGSLSVKRRHAEMSRYQQSESDVERDVER